MMIRPKLRAPRSYSVGGAFSTSAHPFFDWERFTSQGRLVHAERHRGEQRRVSRHQVTGAYLDHIAWDDVADWNLSEPTITPDASCETQEVKAATCDDLVGQPPTVVANRLARGLGAKGWCA